MRFAEAYGLWLERRWAEWFAALSGSIYVLFELIEIYERANWLSIGALLLSVGIVTLMTFSLLHARRGKERNAV